MPWDHFTKPYSLLLTYFFFFRHMQINFPIQENSCNSNFWIAVDVILMVASVSATIASLLLVIWQTLVFLFYIFINFITVFIQIWVWDDGYLNLSPKQLIYKAKAKYSTTTIKCDTISIPFGFIWSHFTDFTVYCLNTKPVLQFNWFPMFELRFGL